MDLKLAGKSVIVTGGGSNIGRAITLAFADENAHITLCDIDEQQACHTAEEAKSRGAASVEVVRADVTDYEQVKRIAATAMERHGAIDCLVNNVGWDDFQYFTQTSPNFWRRVIDINYLGVLHCTRAVLDPMLEARSGSIVSISSDASRQGESREAVYSGCKAAVNSFMKTIAKENGRFGIRCNVVCPGVTVPEEDGEVGDKSMWADRNAMFSEEQFEAIARSLPLKKLGRPRDIANAVAFLSSNAVAGHVTGQVLSVSGGYSMIG